MFRDTPWHAVQYWYRQSPNPMVANDYQIRERDSYRTRVREAFPPWTISGMVGVRLDTTGYLRRFQAIPERQLRLESKTRDPDWLTWFPSSMTSFDLRNLSAADGDWIAMPSTPYDAWAAWEGKWPNSDEPLRVVAAAYRGRPVFFDVVSPGKANRQLLSDRFRGNDILSLVLTITTGLIAVFTAILHLHAGRGDKIGALRLGLAVFTLELIAWLFSASHVQGTAELTLIQTAFGMALFRGAFSGLAFLAVEPLVRRSWPDLLISSTRLLRGRYADPRVGRDLLVGTLVGVVNFYLTWVIPGYVEGLNILIGYFQVLSDSLVFISELSEAAIGQVYYGLLLLFATWLLHRIVRSKLATAALLVVLNATMIFTSVGMELWQLPILVLQVTIGIWLMMRFGIVAWACAGFVWLLLQMPLTTNIDAFYFRLGVLSVVAILAAVAYGAYCASYRELLSTRAASR